MKYSPYSLGKALAAFVLILATGALPALAVEITLQTANDPVSGSEHPDDLYTAALAVDLAFGNHNWTLGERMFTDRERNLRFDETFLEMSRELPEWAGWRPEVSAGLLHIGNGLLGQRIQNEVHRLVGSERVDLPYAESSHWYATGRVRLDRALWSGRRGGLVTRLEAAAAPGFQQSVRAELLADVQLGRDFALRAGVGARAARVDSDLLGDRISELGATWELGFAWRQWSVRYAFNDHGTESQNLSLAVRVGSSGNGGGQAD